MNPSPLEELGGSLNLAGIQAQKSDEFVSPAPPLIIPLAVSTNDEQIKGTFMTSVSNPELLIKDLAAGFIGSYIANIVLKSDKSIGFLDIFSVFIARLTINITYDFFGDVPPNFGGSMKEFIGSSIVAFLLAAFVFRPGITLQEKLVRYACIILTQLSFMQISRLL